MDYLETYFIKPNHPGRLQMINDTEFEKYQLAVQKRNKNDLNSACRSILQF